MNRNMGLIISIILAIVLAVYFSATDRSTVPPSSEASAPGDAQPKSNSPASIAEKQNASKNNFGLQGSYTILTTATEGERPKSYGKLLEFSDSVIINYSMPNQQWYVEQFKIEGGKSVALIEASKYSDKGRLYEIAYTQEKDGYDYCLLFEKGILYRSSTKYKDEYFESLPSNILPQSSASNIGAAPYHRNAKSYLWSGMDGIMLTESDKDKTVCILPNDHISAVFIDSKFPNAYKDAVYRVPRFVNKGTEVIAQVRNQNNDLIGIVLYNLAEDATKMSVELGPPFEATVYPAADRYICIGNGGSRIIDTLNRTVESPPVNYFFETYDCRRYIQVEVNNQDFDDFKAFLCTADKLDDRSNMIVSSEGSNGVYIPNISKSYFTVTSDNAKDFWVALVQY